MKRIYYILAILPFMLSINTFGQLAIQNQDQTLPSPVLNQERGYTPVSVGEETLIIRGDVNNWVVTGGVITNFDSRTDAVTVRWTIAGNGTLQYTGLTQLDYNTGPPNFEDQTFINDVTVTKTIQVNDLANPETYFDTRVVYKNCVTAILKSRGDIPANEAWYWQFTANGTAKDHKVESTLVQNAGSSENPVYETDDNMVVAESGDYYIRAYNTSTKTWSAAKRVQVGFEFQNLTTYFDWYPDTDGDGYGDPNTTPISRCNAPSGYVDNNLDQCPNEYGKNKGCAATAYIAPKLSTDQNYIYTTVPQVPVQDITNIENQHDVIESVSYMDGLGRNIKNIAIGQSPKGNDMISFSTYNNMGKQAKQYLPYTAKTNSGAYSKQTGSTEDHLLESKKFYTTYLEQNDHATPLHDIHPYAETAYDNTPGSTPLKQAAPGKDWAMGSGHEIKFDHEYNQDNEVRKYGVTYTQGDLTKPNLVDQGFYAYKELHKSIVKDEHNNTTVTYTNVRGQVVLTRKDKGNIDRNIDTYTIYDDYGNMSFVLSPKIVTKDGVSTTELNELGYQYKYNTRGQVIEKKDPGKGWEHIVYNTLGQSVLVQSAKMKTENKWLFTKYDFFGRAIYTGICVDSRSRTELQGMLASLPKNALYETKTTDPIAGFENQLYYTNTIYPTNIAELYTITYYDNYDFDRTTHAKAIPGDSIYGRAITNNTLDFATGSKEKVLGTNQWITSLSYYDKDGNAIYTFADNPYLNTIDVVQLQLDFTDKILKSRSYHKKGAATEIVTLQTFTYDHTGRLLDQFQCIGDNSLSDSCVGSAPQNTQHPANITLNTAVNDTKQLVATEGIALSSGFSFKATTTHTFNAEIQQTNAQTGNAERVASNRYDELGQLKTKNVGGTGLGSPPSQGGDAEGRGGLQTINYSYNIRGWLTHINDPDADLGDDLFAYKIEYNQPQLETSAKLYNGNISATHWKTANDPKKYSYSYTYDDENRLKSNLYFIENEMQLSEFYTDYSYDKNGNLTTIFRYGETNGGPIDILDYTYDTGNKLLKVGDQIGNPLGFKDGTNTGNDYTYDIDGNMTQDLNKGITDITYNHLDLPIKITVVQNGKTATTQMVYTASGSKLSKTTTVDGVPKTTSYAGSFVYTDNNTVPEYIHFAEGYIEFNNSSSPSSGGGAVGGGGITYIYQYTDHNGNIRLSYADDNRDGKVTKDEIREEKHYYPFGLQLQFGNGDPRNVVRGRKHNYGFNGIELNQDLGIDLYEMPLRSYDPSIARWTTQDPVVHHMYSPYSAFDNNPVYYSDPSGADSEIPYYDNYGDPYYGFQTAEQRVFGSHRPGTNGYFGHAFGNSYIYAGAQIEGIQVTPEIAAFAYANPHRVNVIKRPKYSVSAGDGTMEFGEEWDDTYKVGKNGEIRKVNDEKYYDKNGNEVDKLVSEKTGKFKLVNKNILNGVDTDKSYTGSTYQYFYLSNSQKATTLFNWLATNTDVEFSLLTYSSHAYVSTSYSADSESGGIDILRETILEGIHKSFNFTHSHPSWGSPLPSGYAIHSGVNGDKKVAQYYQRTFPKIKINWYIKHVGSVNNVRYNYRRILN